MKRIATIGAAIWGLSILLVQQPASAAAPQCAKCKMALASKKDAVHSEAVKVNGKTYYCCKACGAHKAPAKAAATAAPQCPKCKMSLSAKKDAVHSAAVKVNGKTYYCCKACGAHKAPVKAAELPLCPVCKSHRVAAHKDAAHSHPVKIKGKTYYSCCAAKQG